MKSHQDLCVCGRVKTKRSNVCIKCRDVRLQSRERWSRKRAKEWIEAFVAEHGVVPSASLRAQHDGPSDSELTRHWGGVRKALEACGAPLEAAVMLQGVSMRYDHANGVLTDVKGKRERYLGSQPIVVRCCLCEWSERHESALDALRAQHEHVRGHGIKRKRKRWRNDPRGDLGRPGAIPGTTGSGYGDWR